MALNTPYALQNLSAGTPANIFRQQIGSLVGSPGICASGEYAVSQSATPAMSALVGAGRAFVQGTYISDPTGFTWNTQGMYGVYNDAPVTVTFATSNPTNPRIDLIYLQIQDSAYSGTTNVPVFGVVTGTPAATPLVPATPANAIAIGTVAVAANATSIVNANISGTAQQMQPQLGSIWKGAAYNTGPVTLTNLNTDYAPPTAGVSVTLVQQRRLRVHAEFFCQQGGSVPGGFRCYPCYNTGATYNPATITTLGNGSFALTTNTNDIVSMSCDISQVFPAGSYNIYGVGIRGSGQATDTLQGMFVEVFDAGAF